MSKNSVEAKEDAKYEHLPPKITKEKMELSCELNEVEWNARAHELAEAHTATEGMKERKKSVTAELNADLKIAEAKETKLSNIVSTNREQREVVVETVHDYEAGLVITTRTDINEEISRREMTTNERQSGLFDYEAEENEAEDEASTTENATPEDSNDGTATDK